MRDARVATVCCSCQSFFSSFSILPISAGTPSPKNAGVAWGVAASGVIRRGVDCVNNLDPAPRAAIAGEQFISFDRTGRTRRIECQRRLILGRLFPRVENWIDKLPGLLDLVVAREERGVALHRVEDEALVRLRTRPAEA